ncbi:unnamed protein product [Xylocopa violacea]
MADMETISTETLITGLAQTYSIDQMDAAKCLEKTGATTTDILTLQQVLIHENININKSMLRRSTCALTCCAQVAGFMTGAKLEMKVIHKLIEDETQTLKYIYWKFAEDCAELVKTQTDECMVGYEFLRCFINKSREDMYRSNRRK